MNTETWTTKERCMASFWLLCALTFAITICLQEDQADASTTLSSLGWGSLLISFSLTPKMFFQPLRKSINGSLPKPWAFGWGVCIALQMASVVARYAL